MWSTQGSVREQILRARFARELIEFAQVRAAQKEEEQVPRQSGSLEWRLDRGEMGAPVTSNDKPQTQTKKEEVKQSIPQKLMAEVRSEEGKYAHAQKLKVDAQMLYKQLTKGCGNSACSNSAYCIQKTPTAKKEKTEIVQAILKMTISGSYKLCNDPTK